MIYKKMRTIWILLLLMGLSCKSSKSTLFKDAAQWNESGNSKWIFDQNEIIGNAYDESEGFITTKEKFHDFRLEMDFMPNTTINSGVFIRCESESPSSADCYEVNIWDLNTNQKYRTGGIVNKFSPLKTVETTNKWNHCKIIARNDRLKIWMNGVETLDVIDSDHSMGYISLQARGEGKIIFKNIKIQKLN